MDKQIRLMPKYGCSPVWVYLDHDQVDNPDPDELPVTIELREALVRWAAAYEGTRDIEIPSNSRFAAPADLEAFETDGRRLCAELAAELGPDYDVTYGRQIQAGSDDPDTAFSSYEHEHVGAHSAGSVQSFGDRRR